MSSSPDPLALDGQLCFALYAASRAVTRAYAPLLAPLGLTYPQYLAMLVLWERDGLSPGLSVKDLGARLGLDSATLTPLLKRLERQQLIARERSTADARVVHVALTAAGRELRVRAAAVPIGIACAAGFDPADPAALRELARLRDELAALTARLTGDPR